MTFKTTIKRLAFGGDGVGEAPDGRTALIEGAFVGEEVNVEMTSEAKRYVRGRAVSFVSPPQHRIQAP